MNSITLNSVLRSVATQSLGDGGQNAIEQLVKDGFTDEEKAKIAPLIDQNHSMDVIVSQAQEILSENLVCFTEVPSSIFANTYPCKVEFEGKIYASAAECYLNFTRPSPRTMGQKRSVSLDKMNVEAQKEPLRVPTRRRQIKSDHRPRVEKIDGSVRQKKSTLSKADNKEIALSGSKEGSELMMRVLRAKFGNDLELREKLLNTGSAYIVCQQTSEGIWSDRFDGTGKNQLGQCLMELRGEFGGVGVVAKSTAYKIMLENVKQRCKSAMALICKNINVCKEVIWKMFFQCCRNQDALSAITLFRLNKKIYDYMVAKIKLTETDVVEFEELQRVGLNELDRVRIQELCPRLNVISIEDLKNLKIVSKGFSFEDGIGKLGLVQGYLNLVKRVERDEGLTYYIMPEGMTRTKQQALANRLKIKVSMSKEVGYDGHEDDAISNSYALLITNGILKNTLQKEYRTLYSDVVNTNHCAMPTSQEILFLCILTKHIFCRTLYPLQASSTTEREMHEDNSLIIGTSDDEGIELSSYDPQYVSRNNREFLAYERKDTGAGGCLRKYA